MLPIRDAALPPYRRCVTKRSDRSRQILDRIPRRKTLMDVIKNVVGLGAVLAGLGVTLAVFAHAASASVAVLPIEPLSS